MNFCVDIMLKKCYIYLVSSEWSVVSSKPWVMILIDRINKFQILKKQIQLTTWH